MHPPLDLRIAGPVRSWQSAHAGGYRGARVVPMMGVDGAAPVRAPRTIPGAPRRLAFALTPPEALGYLTAQPRERESDRARPPDPDVRRAKGDASAHV